MLFIHLESHASAVSLLESGEQRYIKAINNNNNTHTHTLLQKQRLYLCNYSTELGRIRLGQHGRI